MHLTHLLLGEVHSRQLQNSKGLEEQVESFQNLR